MKTLVNDLHLYELVLLFLGVILFMILSAGLVYYIVKKEEIKKLLFFFPIPIIMIGYPSIQEFTISKDKIELSKNKEKYIDNPNDTLAKQKIAELTEKLKERAQTPEDIVRISEAKLLLGEPEEAIKYADKAIEEQKKETVEENPDESETGVITADSLKIKTTARAFQIKDLAQIQNTNIEEVDKDALENKIENIEVSKDLEPIKKVVAKKTLEKYRKVDN